MVVYEVVESLRSGLGEARPRWGWEESQCRQLIDDSAFRNAEVNMVERIALGILPGTGWRAKEVVMAAQEAEQAGFDAIFNPEVNNEGIATAQLMGSATTRIKVGTWIASIYLRHPYACAHAAALIADATDGRMILGLGISHQSVNAALRVETGRPLVAMRKYVTEVQAWLRGEGPPTHLPQRPAPCSVPIHIAALNSKAVELAGEIADGVMPFLWPAQRVARSKQWIARGRGKAPGRGKCEITLGLPTFIGDNLDRMRQIARQNLALYTTFPYYQRHFRLCGFVDEAEAAEQGNVERALSDRLLEALCLMGPISKCREQLHSFRSAGVDLPILYPAIGVEAARETITAFRQ
jgi:alkanesulfonate monooxygenase SsuD/methylene tetrahydromethanopterin reductase-like flavin-dependent oxidoreductase (luciferase family)